MDSVEKNYVPAAGWNPTVVPDCWLILAEGEVVLTEDHKPVWMTEPGFLKTESVQPLASGELVCGEFNGLAIALVELQRQPETASTISIRDLLTRTSMSVFGLISHALQIARVTKDYCFCGRCGGKTHRKEGEWSVECSDCGFLFYPIISPCVIVLISRGDEVLLVRHHRHGKDSPMHTLVAGFVEPGENVESAVHREVMEETGLRIKNLKYKLSQSWPFPHSLMMGFHAEYESGELSLDVTELCDGRWYHKDVLPELPPAFTISRQLVDIS